jgi:hypothetical protein
LQLLSKHALCETLAPDRGEEERIDRGTYAPLYAGFEVQLIPHAHKGRLLRVDRKV